MSDAWNQIHFLHWRRGLPPVWMWRCLEAIKHRKAQSLEHLSNCKLQWYFERAAHSKMRILSAVFFETWLKINVWEHGTESCFGRKGEGSAWQREPYWKHYLIVNLYVKLLNQIIYCRLLNFLSFSSAEKSFAICSPNLSSSWKVCWVE